MKRGLSHEEAEKVATEAMILVLKEYQPEIVTIEDAMKKAQNIVSDFVDRENDRSGISTMEIEINDYP